MERSTRYWIAPERNALSVYVGKRAPLPGRCAGVTAAKGVARQKEGAPPVTLLPRTRSEGEGTIGVRDGMLSAMGEGFAFKNERRCQAAAPEVRLPWKRHVRRKGRRSRAAALAVTAVTGRGVTRGEFTLQRSLR